MMLTMDGEEEPKKVTKNRRKDRYSEATRERRNHEDRHSQTWEQLYKEKEKLKLETKLETKQRRNKENRHSEAYKLAHKGGNRHSKFPKPEEILEAARQQNGGKVPKPPKHPLILSYELTWRSVEDKKFVRTVAWKNLRKAILIRDDYTCRCCGYKTENTRFLNVNHIDGVPQNNEFLNLETLCNHCHMIFHSGLWATVYATLDIYEKTLLSQKKVIRITRELRELGKNDEEIINICGLKNKVPWKQDLDYLKTKIGFVTSRHFF